MPLFRPAEPVALVSIELDQPPGQTYYPGSTVSGRIVLESPVEEFIHLVKITLQGHNDTYIVRDERNSSNNSSSTYYYRDQTPLFAFFQILSSAEQTLLRTQKHAWQFSFNSFPSMTDNDRIFPYKKVLDFEGAWLSNRHPLPPSFGWELDSRHHASVLYSLEAHLVSSQRKAPPDLVHRIPLNFLPFRRQYGYQLPRQLTHNFEVTASRFQPEKRNWKTALHDTFSSNIEKHKVTLKSWLPQEVHPGEAITVENAITFHSLPDELLAMPEITFEVKKLRLKCIIMYRGHRVSPYGAESHHVYSYRNEEMRVDEHGPFFSLSPQSGRAIRRKDEPTWVFTTNTTVPDYCCPGFQSFAVSLGHRLSYHVIAEIGGKKLELKDEVTRFMVVSPLREQNVSPGPSGAPPAYDNRSERSGGVEQHTSMDREMLIENKNDRSEK